LSRLALHAPRCYTAGERSSLGRAAALLASCPPPTALGLLGPACGAGRHPSSPVRGQSTFCKATAFRECAPSFPSGGPLESCGPSYSEFPERLQWLFFLRNRSQKRERAKPSKPPPATALPKPGEAICLVFARRGICTKTAKRTALKRIYTRPRPWRVRLCPEIPTAPPLLRQQHIHPQCPPPSHIRSLTAGL
jgi:hypothetical protein